MVKRFVLALIIVCLLTLLPFRVAMAEEQPMEASVTVFAVISPPVSGVFFTAFLSTEHLISDRAVAWDSLGRSIAISGGIIAIESSDAETKFIFPIALGKGQTLASFADEVSGIEFSGNKLNIPFKDPKGNRVLSIVIEVKELRSIGNTTEVVVEGMRLKLEEFSADFSPIDEKIGKVSVSFEFDLYSIPPGALIKIFISKALDEAARSALHAAANNNGAEIVDIAYILNIEKTNLYNTNLGEATITMKVGRAWMESYDIANIRILRCSEEGEYQILPTEFKGYEDEEAIFEAISPDGLSLFGLAALQERPMISWGPFIGLIMGLIIFIGVWFYFSILWRKPAPVREGKWPTGLRPEDWKTR